MEKIQQYCTKRNVYITNIAGGVIGVILFFMVLSIESSVKSMDFLSGTENLIGNIKSFCNIYYFNIIVLIVIAAAYVVRFLKLKDQSLETKILLGGSVVALVCSVISLSSVSSVNSLISGDFGAIAGLGDIEGQMKLVLFMIILQVGFACFAGYLLYKNKSAPQVDTASQPTQTEGGDATAGAAVEPIPSVIEKFKTYYATTNGKKNMRIGGAVVGVVLIALIGLSIFDSVKRTPIDLTKSCEVSFEGVSGEGHVNTECEVDYDMNNAEIKTFINSVTYTVDNNGTFKNGDTAKIKAVYSEATAESLKLKPENATKKVKVKGLEVAYKKFKEVPKNISNQFEAAAKQKLNDEIQSSVGGYFSPKAITIDTMECIAVYYDYSSYNTSGTAYYIYRTEETVVKSDTLTEKQVNYHYVSIANIKSTEDVDLSVDSEDIDTTSISIYDKEKTDEKALTSFKKLREDVEVVKETPSALTYTEETLRK